MKTPKAGPKSLKKYERTNLLFFLGIVVVLIVVFVFLGPRFVVDHYRNLADQEESSEPGVTSDIVMDGNDVGVFYLGTKLSESTRQYRSRLEIPPTDDGLVKELFDLPGVEEVTIDQRVIMLKKNGSTQWPSIQSGVRRIAKNHLHIHY